MLTSIREYNWDTNGNFRYPTHSLHALLVVGTLMGKILLKKKILLLFAYTQNILLCMTIFYHHSIESSDYIITVNCFLHLSAIKIFL